jgi:hypothetical protein
MCKIDKTSPLPKLRALYYERRSHTIFMNLDNKKTAPVPRNQVIVKGTVMKVCKELEIEPPQVFRQSSG